MSNDINKHKDDEAVILENLTKQEIEDLDYKTAQLLCKDNDLKAKGPLPDLIDALMIKRFGSRKTFVPGNMKCSFCDAKVYVQSTQKFTTPEGKLAIRRTMKCRGPRAHTYQDTQLVEPNEEQ